MRLLALDVGSGPHPWSVHPNPGDPRFEADDVIHLDYNEWPHLEVRSHAAHLPFKNEVFDYVRASHIIEHLELPEGLQMVQEMARVCKGGGEIEIVIPDFARFLEKWQQASIPMRLNHEMQRVVMGDADLGPCQIHKSIYDARSIEYLMVQCRIKVIKVDLTTRGPRDTIILGIK